MLTALLIVLVTAVMTQFGVSLADVAVVLEGPSTLELATIGGGVLAIYFVATWRGKRKPIHVHRGHAIPAPHMRPLPRTAQEAVAESPSRGAA